MPHRPTRITRLSAEFEREGAIEGVREVFSLTSASGKSMESPEAEGFFFDWAGWYMENFPEQTLLMRGPEDKIIGYLVGCFDSASAGELFERIFYYREFACWYAEYPSHLHVNCHPDYQGAGHGEALVEKFQRDAEASGVKGLHVVTGAGARNRTFYERLKFRQRHQTFIDGRSLVLLGKYL